jgi:threonine/homoserine/homoserine lactone efflux protein
MPSLAAACILAITPGPGIFYVLARTLAGGTREGDVVFFRHISRNAAVDPAETPGTSLRAFHQGVLTELLNPKTATQECPDLTGNFVGNL